MVHVLSDSLAVAYASRPSAFPLLLLLKLLLIPLPCRLLIFLYELQVVFVYASVNEEVVEQDWVDAQLEDYFLGEAEHFFELYLTKAVTEVVADFKFFADSRSKGTS